jgi:two-component system, cell cycle response regulator CpdR
MARPVLLVDDDASVLELVSYMLADLDCDILTARSATEALGAIADDETIEILISDINMPGLAGSDLAERARAYRPELKIILLTGGPAVSRTFPLLRKPFVQSDLQRVMAEATGVC